MKRFPITILLAASVGLAGCSATPEGQTYAIPYDQAYQKLFGMAMTREVCQQTYGVSNASVRMETRTAEQISWIVSSRGIDHFRLTSRLAPALEGKKGTQVALKTEALATNDGTLASTGPASRTSAQATAVFAEKVESTLMGRPFELRRVTAAVDRYLNRPVQSGTSQQSATIQSGIQSAERDVLEFDQREKPPGNLPGERASC